MFLSNFLWFLAPPFSKSCVCYWALPLKKLPSIDSNRMHFKTLDNLGEGANETRFEKHD